MAVTFTDLKTRLNTWLRDTQNLTFTDDEKTEILKEAVADPFVAYPVKDTSLTTAAGTYTYTMPSGIRDVFEVGLDINSDGIFHLVNPDTYDIINGEIHFNDKGLPSGKTIQVIGNKKLDYLSADFPVQLQEYILHLAMIAAFEMLKTSLTNRFLKNDMTMSDIIQSIATHQRRAEELRRTITNQRLVTL